MEAPCKRRFLPFDTFLLSVHARYRQQATAWVVGILLLIPAIPATAQNLVVNPSFEITSSNCSNFGGEGFFTDLAGSWDNASNNAAGDSCSSPDLFSACNIFATGVPSSLLGFQYARTGTRHAGFITYEVLSPYREYIQGRTTTPLQAGQTYCVSMYVSRADGVPYATNNIGVRFTNTQFLRDPCPGTSNSLINLPPQLNYACPAITDTIDWVRLEWSYTASGGEQWFTIGNFFTNANTDIQTAGGASLNPFAYYFIDDVSIVAGSCCYADIAGPSTFCLNDPPVVFQSSAGSGAICNPAVVGTWSGPGITNPATGAFSPQVAGVGTHTITFTLSCGYATSMQVSVGPCTGLTVCSDPATGAWNASGGLAPYTWENQTMTQDCSACLFGCLIPPGCAVDVPTWTTMATGISIPAPTGFPIRLTDAAGTELIITSAAEVQPCAACPTITVSVAAQSDVLCHGGNDGTASVMASGGAAPYSFTWSPGGLSGPAQTTLTNATYTVTAADAGGCTGTTTVTIASPPALVADIVSIQDASCAGNDGAATASASGGSGTLAYAWAPSGNTTLIATGLAPGQHTLTVTDANGCTAQATADMIASEGPVITDVGSTPADCSAPTGTITITATGNGLQYSIDGGNTFQPTGSFSGVAAGPYDVVVTDAAGCTASAQVTVTTLDGPTIDQVTTTAPSCGAADGSITVTATGTGLLYSIDGGLTWQSANVFAGLQAGTWNIVVSANDCTASTVVQLNPDGGPAITVASSSPLCHGDQDGAISVSATGNGPFQFSVDGGATFQPTGDFTSLGPGPYDLVVTDAGGCEAFASATLTDPPALTVNITGNDPICLGNCNGSAQAVASGGTPGPGGYQYAWTAGAPLPGTPQVDGLCSGTHSLTVTDANGCSTTATFTLNAPQAFAVENVQTTPETCPGACDGTLLVIAPDAVLFSINNGVPQNAPLFTGLCAGEQTAGAYDANNCMGTAAAIVGTGAPVAAGFTVDPHTASVLDPVFTFTNTSAGAVDYQWDFGPHGTSAQSDPVLTLPEQATEFMACLTAINAEGCSDTYCLALWIPPDPTIHVPNTFTPDGDGINDVFLAVGDPSLNDPFRLDIFDRWGELIFSSTDITKGWNGAYQGTECMQGVYTWRAETGAPGIPLQQFRGHVTLIR